MPQTGTPLFVFFHIVTLVEWLQKKNIGEPTEIVFLEILKSGISPLENINIFQIMFLIQK